MKKVLIILIVICANVNSYAQDPQLFENTWYLQNIIINGEENIPFSFIEFDFISLSFNETDMLLTTSVCNIGEGVVEFNNPNLEFSFTNGFILNLFECTDPDSIIFENKYFNFYLDNVTESFFYAVTAEGNNAKNLIITSASGDEAIYSSILLSSQDYLINSFSVYPNPVKDELFIFRTIGLDDFTANIFNIDGKLILSINDSDIFNNSIDVKKLTNGIYFILLENKHGRSSIKKFVKY